MVHRLCTKMSSDEQTHNFLKLFVAVRDKGGYNVVSKKKLWDLVAEESGLGSIISSTVKLIYVEYLNVLERWLEKVVEDRDSANSCCSNGDDTGFGFNGLSSDIQSLKKNHDLDDSNSFDCDDTTVVLKTDGDKNLGGCGVTFCQLLKSPWDINDMYEDEDSGLESASNVDENSDDKDKSHSLNIPKHENALVDGVERKVESSYDYEQCDGYDIDDKEGMVIDSTLVEEHNFSHEKKSESILGMVNWIKEIAKNPCNPVIRLLHDSSQWKSSGNAEIWKQVLLIREAMSLKGRSNFYAEQSALQVCFCENLVLRISFTSILFNPTYNQTFDRKPYCMKKNHAT